MIVTGAFASAHRSSTLGVENARRDLEKAVVSRRTAYMRRRCAERRVGVKRRVRNPGDRAFQ